MAERRVTARLSQCQIEKKVEKEFCLAHLGPDAPQGTTEIGEEVPKRSRDTEIKETNQSGFGQSKAFLMSMNATKECS